MPPPDRSARGARLAIKKARLARRETPRAGLGLRERGANCRVRARGRDRHQSGKGYLRHNSELESWMRGKGIAAAGAAQWARYNSPFSLWFLRRNEIFVRVARGVD